jgi:ribonuclease J
MEIDFEKLTNWLAHYGLPQYHVHVSGRKMPLQLRSGLKQIDPQRIFPIHTENAKLRQIHDGSADQDISL